MKNDNKKKQVVIIVLSFLAVCLVAGLFLRTNTAKGTQDMPVQGGERNPDTGKQGDGESRLSSTPMPSGEIADVLGKDGKNVENSPIPTLSEGISPQPSDDKKGAENLPTPTTQGKENNQPGSDAGDTPEAGDKISDSGEKDEMTKPKASATPEPEEVTATPQVTEKPTATPLPEKNKDQSEDRGDTGKGKPEGTKKEDSGNKLNSPSEATPPPTPPADGKDTVPVENPDKDGNCRPEHKNPEKEETKKGESSEGNKPLKKEEKPSKEEPSKKDDSKGEPPSEGAIYVPGFGWVEYEGPNSYEIAPNAGTGDIIGDM